MASDVDICNLALSHIGVGKEIGSLTEKSEEARACNRFFEECRDSTMREFPWPFLRKFVALGKVADDPTVEYDFSYRYPSDVLQLHRIMSGIRHDTRQTRVHYLLTHDDDGLLILTNEEDACIEYTARYTDTERYPSDFVMAFSYLLGAKIAPRLTRGDPFKVGEKAIAFYFQAISAARASAAIEEQPEEDRTSEFERFREGDTTPQSRGIDSNVWTWP
jgi:hypothetical protein